MNREEKLKRLKDLPYTIIWPDSTWTDVGFSERELWINSKGFGYFMCDEPNPVYWKGECLDSIKWSIIKNKIEKGVLTFIDIKETPLVELLNALSFDVYDFENITELNKDLNLLLELKNGACGFIYAIQGDSGPVFFDNELEFKKKFERDWADEYWDDMSDEQLDIWISRLLDL
jgi:hypothetical protein